MGGLPAGPHFYRGDDRYEDARRGAVWQFYAVCGWDAVYEAIGRPEDFSSNLTATMT